MPNTSFKERMLSVIKAEDDKTQLALLLDLIEATHELDDIGRAVKRLSKILALVKSFNPKAVSQCDGWLKILTELSVVIDSPEYQSQIKNPFQLRRHSTKRITSDTKGHEFYAALIVDIHDTVTESCIIRTLAIMLAVKTLHEAKRQSHERRTALLADGVRKANIRESAWEQMLKYLMVGDSDEPMGYLQSVNHRCDALNTNDETLGYKKGQWDFVKNISRCVHALIENYPQITSIPISAPPGGTAGGPVSVNPVRPPGTFDDDDDQIFHPWKIRQIRSTPIESINYDTEGLAPDDYQAVVTQLVAEPQGVGDEQLYSSAHEQIKARFSRYISAIDNQYLPIRWGALNPNELEDIVRFLSAAESSAMLRSVQLVVGLTLVTGQTFECLMSVSLAPGQISTDCRHGLYRYENHFFWAHLIPPLENAYRPDASLKLELDEVGDILTLPLPSIIGRLINQSLASDWTGQSLVSALPVDSEALQRAVANVFTELRRSRRNRGRLSRLRSVLFDSLMFVGGDELAANTLLGLDNERPLTGLYYTTFEVETLQRLYRSAVDRLLPNQDWFTEESPVKYACLVGSKLSVSMARMRQAVSQLREQTVQGLSGSRDLEKIRVAHNQYTNYVLMMLMCSSGHRAVNDAFYDPSALLLEHSAVLITDKVELMEHEGRLVWLGDVATKQHQYYLQHLECLALALWKFEPRLSHAIKTLLNPLGPRALPLFFYLTPSGWASIRPRSLSQSLGSLWPWPLNANRHFLATQLRRLKVPAEYISYQLGHMQIGQMPFGQFSLLSPKAVGAYLVPALTELERQCGWESLPGLRPYGKKSVNIIAEAPKADTLFGAALREHRRSSMQASDSKLVLTAIRQVADGQTWEKSAAIPDEFINAVIDAAKRPSIVSNV